MVLDMPDVYRERILTYRDRRISDSGMITIKAQSHRTQVRNRSDALARLKSILTEAVTVEAPRRITRPSYGVKQRRLKKKTERSQIKKNRGRVRDLD